MNYLQQTKSNAKNLEKEYSIVGVILNKVIHYFLVCGLIFVICQSEYSVAQDQNSIAAQWNSFQNFEPGEYCFFHRENNNKKNTHSGYIIVSISGDSILIKHEGVVIEGNNNWYYSDKYYGTREGNKIFATKIGDSQSTEFIVKNKTLTNKHWMLNKSVAYALEICSD